MLRFLTPTEDWRWRVASKVSLPGEWPIMLVEIFHTVDGHVSMTCAFGVPKSSLKAFLAQGTYLYEFHELPAAIVGILDAHFVQVEKDLAAKIDSLAPRFKPELILVRGDSGLRARIGLPRHGVFGDVLLSPEQMELRPFGF